MNDWILINQLKEGDQAAFKQIVDTWQDMVYNTAIGIVQNPEDAEDVTQEVFVQVFQSIGSFKGDAKLSTWLYRITLSKALDHERKKKRKKRFAVVRSLFAGTREEPIEVPDFNHPGVVLDRKEKAAILFRAMKDLPENQRVAFLLNKVEGLSYQEISEVMETSVSAVESLLHRAKTNLRKTLKDFYEKQ
ncbi:MAG TPA: RNA polymerase sigma factor [Chitinophagaceae bacterium]|nr:RNA polymerase sigma factor [Chitinophagaceae bacterium]